MIRFKNEDGAALVVTLMIVTLLLLFILTQFYQVTNTTKQVDTVGHTIDARSIAEMGIDYYRSKINQFNDEQTIEDFLNGFPTRVEVDGNRRFAIKQKNIKKTNEIITIHISSTGTAYGKNITIQDKLVINLP
ncbi:hypothetical protein [Virgibacillus sp. DJP39]|uniref:hypothetical protein n=1 Tax=Virgibacillus sp. DJP39 TaxID=3409790 RepID=UPI003BB49AF1